MNLEKAVQTAKDAKNAKKTRESEQLDSSHLHLMGEWDATHIYQILLAFLAFLAPLAVQWIFLGLRHYKRSEKNPR